MRTLNVPSPAQPVHNHEGAVQVRLFNQVIHIPHHHAQSGIIRGNSSSYSHRIHAICAGYE